MTANIVTYKLESILNLKREASKYYYPYLLLKIIFFRVPSFVFPLALEIIVLAPNDTTIYTHLKCYTKLKQRGYYQHQYTKKTIYIIHFINF